MSSSTARRKDTLAVLSVGSMGVGFANLLTHEGYRVITNVSGRSDLTKKRARAANIELVTSDNDLVHQADYFLSIVPPKDSLAVAKRVVQALETLSPPRSKSFYFLELNAISPTSARECAIVLSSQSMVKFVDGGIIGGPPRRIDDQTWYKPQIPVSSEIDIPNEVLSALNAYKISTKIGAASGLKMCFASITKGFTAIAVQSFTAAEQLGVLPELKSALNNQVPELNRFAQAGITGCPPKAYRWIREMEEISDTFADAGFGDRSSHRGGELFSSVADVYRFIAEETDCGREQTDNHTTVSSEEVVSDLARALRR